MCPDDSKPQTGMPQKAVRLAVKRKYLTTREEKQRGYIGFVGRRLVGRPKEEQDCLQVLPLDPRFQSLQMEGKKAEQGLPAQYRFRARGTHGSSRDATV